MSGYLLDHSLELLIITVSFLILLLWIVALFRIRKLNKKLEISRKESENFREEYEKLKIMQEDTLSSYNTLSANYDELVKNQEYIKKLAYTDYLTELPNRTALTEMLDSIMLTLRSDEIIGIMDIDIDNFKNINDTLGHSYGDELLIDVTHRIKQVLDENDYFARIGGDEFVIITQNLQDMVSYEDKIRKVRNVFSYPFILSTKEYFVTVSIGVGFAPKDGKTTQAIIKSVDSAMYMAKANGKNTYAYFDPAYNQLLTERIELQSEIRKAIENEEFVLFYQPQMDISKKKIIGFEALIRWNHPSKGLLYPNDFIYLAEETGLIIPIGKWILKTACNQLKEWADMGYNDIIMAVNLSARQFKEKDLALTVCKIVEETGVDPKRLVLEITETVALDEPEYTIETIKELSNIGVRFSLDDFGTGFSSMNYLKKLPIDAIKIDKSFLSSVLDDVSDQKIIQAIISLARNLNIQVIAEGVESFEQEEFLQASKCKYAQGFLYSKPMPKDSIEELLNRMK